MRTDFRSLSLGRGCSEQQDCLLAAMEGAMRPLTVYVRGWKARIRKERKSQRSKTWTDRKRRGQKRTRDAMNKCSSSASSAPSESSTPAETTLKSDSSHSSQLLPNLPDDLAMRCIARVPRFYHSDLSLVAKSWRSMLRSPFFFYTRAALNCTQHLLYLNVNISDSDSSMWFVLDPNPSNPRNLSPVPPIPCQDIEDKGSDFAVIGSKIYVLGGYVNDAPTSTVWIFDCRFNRWEIGPRMRVARESPAVGVLNGKIYVMGGYVNSSALSTDWAEVFDPVVGSWAPIRSPPEVSYTDMKGSAVMEEKFYAMFDGGGFVFDPRDSSWHNVSTELLAFNWCERASGKACVVDEILYYCDWSGEIRGFDVKEGKWKELKWVRKDLPVLVDHQWMVNVGGRLFLVWDEATGSKGPGVRMEIFYAEIEVRKDGNGELWGSVVWSQVILVTPRWSTFVGCLAVEL